ncbi:KM727_gp97-like protein [Aratus pisonii nudivirus]|nr:KM727_gp97-like protein [Aratus pisonii nudivirus]
MNNIWKANYINPSPISNLNDIITTVYIPRQIVVNLQENSDSFCSFCNSNTYQHDRLCLNANCEYNNLSGIDINRYISLGNNLLNYEDLSFKEAVTVCKKCVSCKSCSKRKKGDKCFRHKTCRHVRNKSYYDILNKLSVNFKLQR